MHLGIWAIVFVCAVALYCVVLFLEGQRRSSRAINAHPFSRATDPARGAARQGDGDRTEHTTSRHYARGTR